MASSAHLPASLRNTTHMYASVTPHGISLMTINHIKSFFVHAVFCVCLCHLLTFARMKGSISLSTCEARAIFFFSLSFSLFLFLFLCFSHDIAAQPYKKKTTFLTPRKGQKKLLLSSTSFTSYGMRPSAIRIVDIFIIFCCMFS